jgi:hypothetical protein
MGQKEGMSFSFPEDAEFWSDTVLYGFEERPNIWKLQSRKKYLYETFLKHFYNVEVLTAALNRSAGMLELFEHMKQGANEAKIKNIINECRNTIDQKSPKYRNTRDLCLQFLGVIQNHAFYEERGY